MKTIRIALLLTLSLGAGVFSGSVWAMEGEGGTSASTQMLAEAIELLPGLSPDKVVRILTETRDNADGKIVDVNLRQDTLANLWASNAFHHLVDTYLHNTKLYYNGLDDEAKAFLRKHPVVLYDWGFGVDFCAGEIHLTLGQLAQMQERSAFTSLVNQEKDKLFEMANTDALGRPALQDHEVPAYPWYRKAWNGFLGRPSHGDNTWAAYHILGLNDGRTNLEAVPTREQLQAAYDEVKGEGEETEPLRAIREGLIEVTDDIRDMYQIGGDRGELLAQLCKPQGGVVQHRHTAHEWAVRDRLSDVARDKLGDTIRALRDDKDFSPLLDRWGGAMDRGFREYTRSEYHGNMRTDYYREHGGSLLELQDDMRRVNRLEFLKKNMKSKRFHEKARPYYITAGVASVVGLILLIRHHLYWQAIHKRLWNVLGTLSSLQKEHGRLLTREQVATVLKEQADGEKRPEMIDAWMHFIALANELIDDEDVLIGYTVTFTRNRHGELMNSRLDKDHVDGEEHAQLQTAFQAIKNIWRDDKSVRAKLKWFTMLPITLIKKLLAKKKTPVESGANQAPVATVGV